MAHCNMPARKRRVGLSPLKLTLLTVIYSFRLRWFR